MSVRSVIRNNPITTIISVLCLLANLAAADTTRIGLDGRIIHISHYDAVLQGIYVFLLVWVLSFGFQWVYRKLKSNTRRAP